MKKNKIFMTMLLLVLGLVLSSGKAYAVNADKIQESDTTHALTITRNVEKVTNPVTNKFTYTIEADASNPQGGATNIPASIQIEFAGVQPNEQNVATKTGTLEFANAEFSKLGDYKFIISETGSTDAVTFPLSEDKYYVYVQVRNELKDGAPTGNLVATLISQGTITTDTDGIKRDIVFPADSVYTHVSMSKIVTGNMADSDEYFKFKIEIEGNEGDQYDIIGQDGSVKYAGETISTKNKYIVGQDNYVYLKDKQSITIGVTSDTLDQIKVGAKYTIVEQDATTYKTFIDGSTTDNKSTEEKTTDPDASKNTTAFVNNKEEPGLTGVLFSIAPFIGILLPALFGVVIIMKMPRKNAEI